MDEGGNLILFGASTRAAAFSALRAGLRPWCADLFADADLQARCPAMRLPGPYPTASWNGSAPSCPARGCTPAASKTAPGSSSGWPAAGRSGATTVAALLKARNPAVVHAAVRAAGLPAPAVHWFFRRPPAVGRWLVKPIWGIGDPIHFWTAADAADRPSLLVYLQEFIEGESQAAIYCGDGKRADLLGVTRQLVGEDWLHAGPFRYCGSVGPLRPDAARRQALEKIGAALARRCGLRGLFGVDGVVRDGAFLPVEVNPRYTASVEVLEYAGGLSAMAWHRAAFAAAPRPAPPAEDPAGLRRQSRLLRPARPDVPGGRPVGGRAAVAAAAGGAAVIRRHSASRNSDQSRATCAHVFRAGRWAG